MGTDRQNEIADRILEARKDREAMNRFIEENRAFIRNSAYRCVNRYVTESDDEYSIAMIAFHEAVMSYREDKGEFYAFAGMVIRRRLLDYLKSEARHKGEMSVDPAAMSGDLGGDSEAGSLNVEVVRQEARQSVEASEEQERAVDRKEAMKEEIAAVQKLLSRYGFSFFDLAECSPKTAKTKQACAAAVAALLQSEILMESMRKSGTLPIREISEKTGIARKILERHRRYIIAAAEILNGEYPLLAEYMNYIRKSLGP